MSAPVSLEQSDGIAVITVNHPPVNALSHAVRTGLIDCFRRAGGDPNVRGIVLHCAGRTFIAGADISEFGRPHAAPTLLEVLETIEQTPKPVVAAIHGTALGGGLETALCCSHRVASPTARIGLPEVKLGLLPGAGGTQRLPRVLGVPAALEAMISGRMIPVSEVVDTPAVDAILDGELPEAAVAWLRQGLEQGLAPRRVRDLAVPGSDDLPADFFATAHERTARQMRGQIAPLHIIDCVEAAATLPFEQGMEVERTRFAECMASPQSAALRHLFFAERQTAKVPDIGADTVTRPIRRVAVIGAGTMGGGIAMCFANAGLPVTLIDSSETALARGRKVIVDNYQRSAARGRLSEQEIAVRVARIEGATALADAAGADLVIEAVFEDMALKKRIFAELGQHCRGDAILASNTSTLDIDEIARAAAEPSRVLGLHFFSPANVMRLLEIVRGADTAPDVLATCLALSRTIGKIGVVSGVCYGFIGNRMLEGYGREAGMLLLEGATAQDIDRVIVEFGLPMGPHAMGDLAGNDVGALVRAERRTAGALPDDPRYGAVGDRLAALGRHGQKTGKGIYAYSEDRRTPQPDPQVAELVAELADALGIVRRRIDDQEILERCLYPLVNEGMRILEEGIALRASDIDVVWVYGYGFPAWRGGPMHWAEHVGLAHVLARLRHYGALLGNEHGYWTPAPLLERLVAEGGSLADYRPA